MWGVGNLLSVLRTLWHDQVLEACALEAGLGTLKTGGEPPGTNTKTCGDICSLVKFIVSAENLLVRPGAGGLRPQGGPGHPRDRR